MRDRIISYIFHPVIFPLIGSLIYLFSIPKFITQDYKRIVLLIVFFGSFFIPILLLALFKYMGFIKSFHLHSIGERKIPLLYFAFIAILIGKLLSKITFVDDLVLYFLSGGYALLIVYWFLWYDIKVSLHTLGVGGLIGFLIQLSIVYQVNYLLLIAVLFIIFGVIAFARLNLKAHNFKEVLLGVSIAIIMQLIIPLLYQKM